MSIPEQCQQRRAIRLKPIKRQCCKDYLYCRCIQALCGDHWSAKDCQAELKDTCKTKLDLNCPNIAPHFTQRCPGVPQNILETDTWSSVAPLPADGKEAASGARNLNPNLAARTKYIAGAAFIILLLCLVGGVVWWFWTNKKSSSRGGGSRSIHKISSERKSRNKAVSKRRTNADRSGRGGGSTERRPANTIASQSRPRGRTSSNARSISRGSKAGPSSAAKTKTATSQQKIPSNSFNSRAVNTVQRPTNVKQPPRPVMTYDKFKKALE